MGNFTSRRKESHDEPSANNPSEAEASQSTGSTSNNKRARVNDEESPAAVAAAAVAAQPASKKRKVKTRSVRASSKKGLANEEERMKSFLLKLKKLPEYHPNSGIRHSWEDNYAQLKLFKEHFGHCKVPSSAKLPQVHRLASWLEANKCRKHRPYGTSRKLTKEQVDKLDKLGVDWTK